MSPGSLLGRPACLEQRRTLSICLEDHNANTSRLDHDGLRHVDCLGCCTRIRRLRTHRKGEANVRYMHVPRSCRPGGIRTLVVRARAERSINLPPFYPLAPRCDRTRHPGTQHVCRRRPRMSKLRDGERSRTARAAGTGRSSVVLVESVPSRPRGLAAVHVRPHVAPPAG